MTETALPPLPVHVGGVESSEPLYSADQMRDYARAAIAIAEKAEPVCSLTGGNCLPGCVGTPYCARADTTPQAPKTEPAVQFADARVQVVYEFLCSDDAPPLEQHWEGWVARKIVDALTPQPETVTPVMLTPAQQAATQLTDEQIDRAQEQAYRNLVAHGYKGGMGDEQWDRASARAIERAHWIAAVPQAPKASPLTDACVTLQSCRDGVWAHFRVGRGYAFSYNLDTDSMGQRFAEEYRAMLRAHGIGSAPTEPPQAAPPGGFIGSIPAEESDDEFVRQVQAIP